MEKGHALWCSFGANQKEHEQSYGPPTVYRTS